MCSSDPTKQEKIQARLNAILEQAEEKIERAGLGFENLVIVQERLAASQKNLDTAVREGVAASERYHEIAVELKETQILFNDTLSIAAKIVIPNFIDGLGHIGEAAIDQIPFLALLTGSIKGLKEEWEDFLALQEQGQAFIDALRRHRRGEDPAGEEEFDWRKFMVQLEANAAREAELERRARVRDEALQERLDRAREEARRLRERDIAEGIAGHRTPGSRIVSPFGGGLVSPITSPFATTEAGAGDMANVGKKMAEESQRQAEQMHDAWASAMQGLVEATLQGGDAIQVAFGGMLRVLSNQIQQTVSDLAGGLPGPLGGLLGGLAGGVIGGLGALLSGGGRSVPVHQTEPVRIHPQDRMTDMTVIIEQRDPVTGETTRRQVAAINRLRSRRGDPSVSVPAGTG